MKRMTIDCGIDLGTTNSAVAFLKGSDVVIVKNNEGSDYTPSAVFIDKNDALIVGTQAKGRLETEPENAYAEFKLQMGTDTKYFFARSQRTFSPEGLSAEVLKSLKSDVRDRLGEDVSAAVITVPAAFDIGQCNATKKAAELAGIDFCLLVTEPAAAAFAYVQKEKRNAFWLVYDLGGGTFDAAVVKVRDGVIQVVNHAGDKHLGSKLIDWAIVDNLLVPALTQKFSLSDFRRGNEKHRKAFAKLKQAAEQAKIAASRLNSVEIVVESVCSDDYGQIIDFQFDLKKSDVENIAHPLILKTINRCRDVLADKRLKTANIERVLLVGGPTMTPYLREFLQDSKKGLGIPLEFSLDPLTVVARGAALFAGTQKDESVSSKQVSQGQFLIELPDYKPVGSDPEPFIGGCVAGANGEDTSQFTIEFINTSARTGWRSGKIPLSPNGSFSATLWAEPGTNTFKIELQDATGSTRQIVPNAIPYTIGIEADNPTLIHSIGLALADNNVRVFFEKGVQLPTRKKRFVQKLAHPVKKGEPDAVIRLPVVEGDHEKADRNQLIGYLEISATEITRDLPATAEVEITIAIDQSRLVHTGAYITMLQREFEKVLTMTRKIADPEELKKELEEEKERFEKARERLYITDDSKAKPILERIQNERILEEVESSLDAAAVDRDAADKTHHRLLEFKATIDELDDALEIPTLLVEAQQVIEWATEIVNEWGTDSDQLKLRMLVGELRATMEARTINPADLNRRIDNLDSLRIQILHSKDEWWISYFAKLVEQKDSMKNPAIAESLCDQARRSINNNDMNGLKSACYQLGQLLPVRLQQTVGRLRSSVTN